MAEYPEVMWCNRDDDMIHFGELQSVVDDDVRYLRADTCTENEKLEELIQWIERAEAHYCKPRDNPSEDFHQGQATAFGKCVQMLREVMK